MKRLRGDGYDTVGIGKMHYRSDKDDNGFLRYIETMHVADGVGDLVSALRFEEQEPTYRGLWDIWTSRYGAGDSDPYRQYDERICREAVKWLESEATDNKTPWALSVHFIAAHAPFVCPDEFHQLYDPTTLPPPVRFERHERPRHPSIVHLRKIICHEEDLPLDHVQELRAAYFATVSYLDHLIGRLLSTLEARGLAEDTLIIYTSDHGFSLGDHYIFGLFHLFEESLKVPLIMAGPHVPEGHKPAVPVSHTDLYPTILENCAIALNEDELKAGGKSLWPVINGDQTSREPVFAEYHGTGTLTGGYVVRDGTTKLIYFVGMPPQLYNLAADPDEANDLAADPVYGPLLEHMLAELHRQVDPERVDSAAKIAQRRLIERHGGKQKVLKEMAGFSYSPPRE